jgi:uncharacterized protein
MFYERRRLSDRYLWLGLVVLLIGCSFGLNPAQGESPPSAISPTVQPQTLPIAAVATIVNTRINLEVAGTPEQQETGLMQRTSLADDRGMLFPFQPARPVAFWMKNCLISLDMVFIRLGKVVAIAAEAPPCTKEPCAVYPSRVPIDRVIELRGGRAAELGLKVGDPISIEFL